MRAPLLPTVYFILTFLLSQAFPVLCRILTELDLLNTRVGVIVLSAGVGNDIVGWVLLALCVALVNASTGLTALYVLLTCVGFTLFLVYAVRPVFMWYLKRTGSLHNGPNQSVVALTLLLALAAAFFTQVIGVHAIFGGFMVGIICPHDGGFAIKLTEKIEDLIGALFLPLYFALSGLNTNVGLLDSGLVWGYVFAVVFIAFIAKVSGGMVASRLTGLRWRESCAVGVLMSCKGLVELIVLVSMLVNASHLLLFFTDGWIEYRIASQDSQHSNIYYFCCYGSHHHLCHDPPHHVFLPRVVSDQGGELEARRNRLGRKSYCVREWPRQRFGHDAAKAKHFRTKGARLFETG